MEGVLSGGGVGSGEDIQGSGALAHGDGKSTLKRTNQVKVLLNEDELKHLDWIVAQMGSDRSSAMRYLLASIPVGQVEGKASSYEGESANKEITRIRIGEVPASKYNGVPYIKIFEPREFDQVPQAIEAIREGESVIMNLTMMKPEQAQRAVDFVAGGTFYGRGFQERIGESIFLFASKVFEVRNMAAVSDDKKSNISFQETHHIGAAKESIHALTPSADSSGCNDETDEQLDNCNIESSSKELSENPVEKLSVDIE